MNSTQRLEGRARCRRSGLAALALLLVMPLALPGAWAADTQQEIRWDLSQIFEGADEWEAARAALEDEVSRLVAYKGRLGESAAALEEALDLSFDLQKRAARLYAYAGMKGDEDLDDPTPQGMEQQLRTLFAEMGAELAWMEPELLSIPAEKLASFVEERAGLHEYRRYLERLEKRRAHVLEPDIERVLGLAGMTMGEGATIGGLLRDAEMPWKTIELDEGRQLKVNSTGYSIGRALPEREARVATYDAFYSVLSDFESTLAAALASTVKENVFTARVRNYDSALEASLARNEVDPAVYAMLVEEVNAGLPVLYRYLKLRESMLGLEDLAYHDMYPPLVPENAGAYDWQRSKGLVLEALAPLGEDYVKRFAEAIDGRYIDVYPREGKRSGAYVNDAAYDVHPFMLLNHTDDYSSLSTFAHEGGHMMHSIYAQASQPYPTSDYSIFVAEVASTVNEVLLFRHLLDRAENDEERLALLGNFLEGVRLTVFRQTMFAEFERDIYAMLESGKPLTAESMNALYLGLLRRYHGSAEGITEVPEDYAVEWAFIPHFHYNFYVYQYATSYIAAIAIAEELSSGDSTARESARERYIAFLSGGSAKPPVELLAAAGVDMTSPEPARAAMRFMDGVIAQIEEIRAKKSAARESASAAPPAS